MANYFTNCNKNHSKKQELREALKAIYTQEHLERFNYLVELESLIKSRPGLTASQYAALLSTDACERNSIRTSIGVMGHVAEHHRKYQAGKLGNWVSDLNPTIPTLVRKEHIIKRRFIEVDENNQPIGTHEYEECKYTYSMEG